MENFVDQETTLSTEHRLLPQPLLGFALAVIVGIGVARLEWLPLWGQVVGVVFCLIMAALFLIPAVYARAKHPNRLVLLFLLGGVFFLGQLRYTSIWSYYSHNDIYRYSQMDPQLVTVRGRIVRSPYVSKSRGRFAKFDFRHDARTIFTLACSEIRGDQGWQQIDGQALVVVKKPALHLQFGQIVEIDGWLSRRAGPSNPGEYDRTDRHRASRTLVSLSSSYSEAVKIIADGKNRTNWRNKLQQTAYLALFSESVQSKDTNRDFLAALLLGDREGMYDGLSETFIRCGSMHFLSVSGLHLGILAGFVWWIGRVLPLPRWVQGVLPLLTVLLFMAIVPERPPIVRAGIMSSVFCIAYMTRRQTSSLNLLSLAAIIILLLQPLDLFDAGFQLSFSVVLGLFVFVPRINRLQLFSLDDPLARVRKKFQLQERTWLAKIFRWFVEHAWSLMALALVSWLVGLPLVAYHFHRIAPWGILASVLLFFPIAALLLLGFLKIILAFVLPAWSMQLAGPLNLLSDMTIGLAEWLSRLPGNQIITAAAPIWFIGIFYLLLCISGYRLLRGQVMGKAMVLGISVWLIVFVWWVPFRDHETGRSTFHILNVGHGSAVIGELADGRILCYDAGSMSRLDIGPAVILPFLRSQGIGRIDDLFISHANLDHYSAIPDLCDNMTLGSIYTNDYFTEPQKANSARVLLLNEIRATGLEIQRLNQEDHLPSIEILWPPANEGVFSYKTNDQSLVLRITQPGGSILLAGDIGEIPQKWLITHGSQSLKSDLLLLPHHGGVTKSLTAFVEAVDPMWIVNSSGYLNRRSLDRLQNVLGERKIFHTFTDGAIRINFIEGADIWVEGFR